MAGKRFQAALFCIGYPFSPLLLRGQKIGLQHRCIGLTFNQPLIQLKPAGRWVHRFGGDSTRLPESGYLNCGNRLAKAFRLEITALFLQCKNLNVNLLGFV